MSKYDANGKGHKVLRQLADHGTASYEQLADDLNLHGSVRRKLWHLLGQMLLDGLIGGNRRSYHLLPNGERALQALDCSQAVSFEPTCLPNARVFVSLLLVVFLLVGCVQRMPPGATLVRNCRNGAQIILAGGRLYLFDGSLHHPFTPIAPSAALDDICLPRRP